MTARKIIKQNLVSKENKLKMWLLENKWKLIFIFTIYQIAILSIGIVNFPYIDDTSRQLHGGTDFAWSYSRWGSEFAAFAVQGSRHLTDMGLVTHILTGIFLSISSLLAVYILTNRKLDWIPLAASTLIGLNPWFLECISFRFDSPYMALSILVSMIPFLWWDRSKKHFFIISMIGIFLMCNTYQASSGIYIVMVLALTFRDILAKQPFSSILKKIILGAVSYVVAMGAYSFEMSLNPSLAARGESFAIPHIMSIPSTIITNISMYQRTIYSQSAKIWLVICLILAILFVLSSVLHSKLNVTKSLLYIILYLILAFVLSYGVFIVFSEPLASVRPRYMHGFGAFVGITLILLNDQLTIKPLNLIAKFVTILFLYYTLSFPFIYASALNYQKDSFERQSILLATELTKVVTPVRNNVFMNTLFIESPILLNSASNYPILTDLVPSNELIYWPNVILFNTYSNLNVNIEPFDFTNFEKSDKQLEATNVYYDIYTTDNQIFIFMK